MELLLLFIIIILLVEFSTKRFLYPANRFTCASSGKLLAGEPQNRTNRQQVVK